MSDLEYREVKIKIHHTLADNLERLQQRIIASTVGEEAIDNGKVTDLTAERLLDLCLRVGYNTLYNDEAEIYYKEDEKKWVVSKP